MSTAIDFKSMKAKIDRYYNINNFDEKEFYIIEFNNEEFRSLLKALKKYYNQQLFGRKVCNKGYYINFPKLKIIE